MFDRITFDPSLGGILSQAFKILATLEPSYESQLTRPRDSHTFTF